jgi:hypothetical protein
MSEKQLVRECRFAVHFPAVDGIDVDTHLIKEQVHNSDGTITPNIRFVQDYKRSFYVTKKAFRNHKQKKEWEDIDKLIKYQCTENELRNTVAKALGKSWTKDNMRRLSNDPYLYGSDISSTSCIKQSYFDKFPGAQSKYTVATFDIETDVVGERNEIIIATLAFKNMIFTGVLKSFVSGINEPVNRVLKCADKYIGEYIEKLDLKIEVFLADTPEELVQTIFAKAHEWMPDFVAIWNINYDIPKVIEACKNAGIDPKQIFSDPSVPEKLKFFDYTEGKKKKITASGLVTPINPAAQWHVLTAPASFYVIDAMCMYKQIRTGTPEEQSYSLDAILNKELGIRKLAFKEADDYHGLEKHQFLQTHYKLEYIVYNMFDSLSMLELDKKTNDLSFTTGVFAGCSDFARFNSQPKKAVDTLHFYALANGKVIGSTGSGDDPMDNQTYGLGGWIVMLPSHLVTDNGMNCISEYPNIHTSVRVAMAD